MFSAPYGRAGSLRSLLFSTVRPFSRITCAFLEHFSSQSFFACVFCKFKLSAFDLFHVFLTRVLDFRSFSLPLVSAVSPTGFPGMGMFIYEYCLKHDFKTAYFPDSARPSDLPF